MVTIEAEREDRTAGPLAQLAVGNDDWLLPYSSDPRSTLESATPTFKTLRLCITYRVHERNWRGWREMWNDVARYAQSSAGNRGIRFEQDARDARLCSVVLDWDSSDSLARFWRGLGMNWADHAADHISTRTGLSVTTIEQSPDRHARR